jgi:cation diffusion facilitator family transporter
MPRATADRESKRVIYAAIVVNVLIAICKFAAAIVTRSSAMMAEAVHSSVDTGNELLLLLGIRRSHRPPDPLHPYGHGKAVYFYSLLVAVYIFALGGGFTIYRGIHQMLHPALPERVGWSYVVLAAATLFELYSWRISYAELRRRKDPDESIFSEIVTSKDPTVFTVFLEDTAGVIGAPVALLGIFLSDRLHNPYFDPAASIVIGLLLAAVAVLLGRETGALLIGESTTRKRIQKIAGLIAADPDVDRVGQLLTMQLGPRQALLTVEIRFRRGLSLEALEHDIARIKTAIREQEPVFEQIFIAPDPLAQQTTRDRHAA